MREQRAHADEEVAAIASRQYGVITSTQLTEAGIDKSGVSRRLRRGRLHRIHRGVYAVGHRGLSHRGRWTAAVLACGPGAALSHRAAAELWELLSPSRGDIDVSVPGRGGRKRRRGLRIHRSHLPENAITRHHRIAVTTPARALRDLRRTVAPGIYRRALREAEYRGLDLGGLPADGTRSEAESAFLRLCRGYRLPAPAPNQRIGPYTVDFLWRAERLVVEVDGWSSHRGRQAFEDDRQRDLFLRARGFTVLRFTARQVRSSPARVAESVRQSSGLWVPPRA